MEKNYDFRRHLLTVHQAGRRDSGLVPAEGELALTAESLIIIARDAGRVISQAARDLQDYLAVSMDLEVRIQPVADVAAAAATGSGRIIYATRQLMPDLPLLEGVGAGGFRIDCRQNVLITGYDSRGAQQGGYYLEDLMNLRKAPFLEQKTHACRPLFSPRMVHSGYGLDQYPDAHIAAIAHAGMDAILVFVKGVDETPFGYLDFNELCYRAAAYAVDVYVYSYLTSALHPDDPGAAAYYERVYGAVFAACPGFRGIVMVGESVEFPSRDPHTTGRLRLQADPDGLPPAKPSPGWWPCQDYPQWVSLIRDTIRGHKPDADIVFWTYNWGYVAEEYRLALIDSLPADISLLVTFEMFEKVQTGPVTSTCVDYTLMIPGPGGYFLSEARKAKERGIRLYAMVNTGGLTWDIGVIPYEPVPQQWMARHGKILECRDKYGLCGLMESHHYGFWPSFVSDLAKWTYLAGTPQPQQVLQDLAARLAGQPLAGRVVAAWSLWSEGIRHYLSTNEDQYGPFRIGPAYPLVLMRDVKVPASSFAVNGGSIINTVYGPSDSGRCSLFSFRLPVEMASLERMRDCFDAGADQLAELLPQLTGSARAELARMANLGRFMARCAQTTLHVKRWYEHKQKLLAAASAAEVRRQVAALQAVGEAEIANSLAAIPLVRQDSRLGWEPTMEYMCDEQHLNWKIRQVRQVLDTELPLYLEALQYGSP